MPDTSTGAKPTANTYPCRRSAAGLPHTLLLEHLSDVLEGTAGAFRRAALAPHPPSVRPAPLFLHIVNRFC